MVRALFLLISLLLTLSPVYAAGPTLSVGEEVPGILGAREKADFSLELGADYFVYGVAMQKSVDVIVEVTGPDGSSMGTFDVTGQGPDYFQFTSTVAGRYNFTVKPFQNETGDFSLLIYMAEPVATTPAGRVDQLLVQFANTETPGAVVAIVEDGEISFAKAYGMANLTHSIPFTTDTVTNIGSTSKQFTAFAINLLADAGKLSLDDDVRKYIPEIPDFGEVVTIGHLLSHTSGYREFLNGISMGGRMLNEGDFIARDEILALVVRQPELQNSPGAKWNYCNTGYSFLALIVERVSEQSFGVWLQENVFEPLGMKNTQVRMHRGDVIGNSAQGYVRRAANEAGFHEVPDIAGSAGAGGIYTTVADLALWMRNLHTGELGGEKLIARMMTPFVLTDGEASEYGMGLFIGELRGLRRIQHGGADSAHRAMLMYFPEIDKGVITLSNNGHFSTDVATEIAEAFFEKHMDPVVAVTETNEEFDAASYEPEDFDELVGRFELEGVGLVLNLTREGDTYYCQATGQPKVAIEPTDDLEFNIVVVGAAINFHRDDDGAVNSLTLHQGGGIKGHRVADEPWKLDAEEMGKFVGRYYSAELEAFYEVVVQDDALVLRHRRFGDRKLKAMKLDQFQVGYPLGEMSFVRDATGLPSGFTAANGRTLGVVFERVN